MGILNFECHIRIFIVFPSTTTATYARPQERISIIVLSNSVIVCNFADVYCHFKMAIPHGLCLFELIKSQTFINKLTNEDRCVLVLP